jgi:hypothetical protein
MARRLAWSVLFASAGAGPALAHSAERGFVLLLPTGLVIAAGAAAVAFSFLALSFLPAHCLAAVLGRSLANPLPRLLSLPVSFLSAVLLLLLVWAGYAGTRDPLENPLPLMVWTLWWVVLVLLHPVLGNLWHWLNPFPALLELARVFGIGPARLAAAWPTGLDYVPALAIFAGFAWFQLVYPGPEDPSVLATAILAYGAVTLAAALAFGPEVWFAKGDPFAIFLRLLAAVAPMGGGRLRWPGAGLLSVAPLPLAGTGFVLLMLASVTFDGFSNTFFWLALGGINPLDFPGRTAVIGLNSLGLAGAFVALLLFYGAAIAAGWRLAGRPRSLAWLMGRFVVSLIPISIAFHFAHYLTDLLVNGQYALASLNDPFARGWNLLGLADMHVTTSFLNTASGALAIYTAKTGAIVLGHVAAVAAAHAMVAGLDLDHRRAMLLELPLAIAMVAYTGLGLWTLSTPAIG